MKGDKSQPGVTRPLTRETHETVTATEVAQAGSVLKSLNDRDPSQQLHRTKPSSDLLSAPGRRYAQRKVTGQTHTQAVFVLYNMSIYISISLSLSLYIYTHVCTSIYIYIYIYIYIVFCTSWCDRQHASQPGPASKVRAPLALMLTEVVATCLHFLMRACHPSAGGMLTLSVSFQV